MSFILNQLSALSGLLPIGAAGLRYRTYGGTLRLLAWFFVVSGLFDLASVITDHWNIRNLPLFHLFSVVNLLFLSAFYHRIIQGRRWRQAIWVAAGLILLFTLYRAVLPGGLWQFPSAVMTAQCGLFMALALLYFYQWLHQPVLTAIEHNPLFWVNAGVLVYFSGNLFLFMLQEWISRTPQPHHANYWAIHSVANIVANLLYAIGLLCKPPRLT